MKTHLATARNILLAVFILAALIAFFVLLRDTSMTTKVAISTGEKPIPVYQLEVEKSVPVIASIIASLTTLLGFVLTSTLSLRKEKRESREAELALKQKEIELQRALLELEELKEKMPA